MAEAPTNNNLAAAAGHDDAEEKKYEREPPKMEDCTEEDSKAEEEEEDDDDSSNDEKMPSTVPPLESLTLSSDPALGHTRPPQQTKRKPPSKWLQFGGTALRSILLDAPLVILFALYVSAILLHKIHDDYLKPQLELMQFISAGRDFTDTTYFHRHCDGRDVSARSVDELVIPDHFSTEDAMHHMLQHGASLYQNLLTPETARELRDFILEENPKQEGWFVIENDFRWSWGIDVNMHPALKKYWKELASNEQFVTALQAIVGPDPAIIEFTAITSAYGARDQHDHQDVVPPGSAAKFARTFIPSYSLFIPLQDTTYDMGATHVCPGTHLCSTGCEEHCTKGHNLAMSGDGIWPQGSGALLNQQLTHKGMGHFKEGGLDRVVIIATFAPRPQTFRGLETRMIGQGGSYSLKWSQWGHTFSDFVHAETRMTEPQKTMRSLGLIKGNGWNFIHQVTMRIANSDTGYNDDGELDDYIQKGGLWFLPQSWQGAIDGDQDILDDGEQMWHAFLLGTLKRTGQELQRLSKFAIIGYLVTFLLLDIFWLFRKRSQGSCLLRSIQRLFVTHGLVALIGWFILNNVQQSNWAKDIRSGKAYQLPAIPEVENTNPATLPNSLDILIAPDYASDHLASYGRILEVAHPGNKFWKDLVRENANGYAALSQPLQQQLCQSMIRWVQQERRFLIQDQERQWTTVTDLDQLSAYCRKKILTASSPLIDALVRQVDSLKADAKFGRWHDCAIHRNTIPSYLDVWADRFVRPLSISKSAPRPRQLVKWQFRPLAGKLEPTRKSSSRTYSLPPEPDVKEPYEGAWFQEDDVVEAQYGCKYNEWYRGKIVGVTANEGYYDVMYGDGEVDESLLSHCIRRWVPYEVGETVEFQPSEEEFYRGRIILVHEGDEEKYDIEAENGDILTEYTPVDLRRFAEVLNTFKNGAIVMAEFQGNEEWFPGKIVSVHGDGTYAVLYNDGDYEKHVHANLIEPARAS